MVYLLAFFFFLNKVLFLEATKHHNPTALSSYITQKELTQFYNSSSHYDTVLALQLLIPRR